MPFINYNTRKKIKVMDGIHGPVYHSERATFAQFTLEHGAILPAHHHHHEQWTHIIEGALEFTIDGETEILTPGMTAYIPSNTVHSARVIEKCKVIDYFSPIREDFLEKERE
jgi:quercetin dioxygenase-like cupin family protein